MDQNNYGAQFKFGEGRISGWISVSLGVLSVLGVLCFHFPDLMTRPSCGRSTQQTRCATCSMQG